MLDEFPDGVLKLKEEEEVKAEGVDEAGVWWTPVMNEVLTLILNTGDQLVTANSFCKDVRTLCLYQPHVIVRDIMTARQNRKDLETASVFVHQSSNLNL